MNLLTEAAIALVIALLIGVFGFYKGDQFGTSRQKVADQAEFDKINAERTKQKAEASALLEKIQAGIIAGQQHEAELNARLEKQDAQYRASTDDLRKQLATRGLQYAAPKGRADASTRERDQATRSGVTNAAIQ